MSTINHVSGRKYRILKDAVNKVWDEISFVNDAQDTYALDGMTVEQKIGDVKGLVTARSDQAGYVLDSRYCAAQPVTLSATLVQGQTTLTFTNTAISVAAKTEIFTNVWGVGPSNVVQSGTTLTLTFPAQENDVTVKVQLSAF